MKSSFNFISTIMCRLLLPHPYFDEGWEQTKHTLPSTASSNNIESSSSKTSSTSLSHHLQHILLHSQNHLLFHIFFNTTFIVVGIKDHFCDHCMNIFVQYVPTTFSQTNHQKSKSSFSTILERHLIDPTTEGKREKNKRNSKNKKTIEPENKEERGTKRAAKAKRNIQNSDSILDGEVRKESTYTTYKTRREGKSNWINGDN